MINGIWTPIYDSSLPQRPSESLRKKGVSQRPYITKYIDIPCGQCIGCRLQRSREWANRMMMELETTAAPSSFITLTYDDDHIPMSEGVNPISGELMNFGNLVLKDLQDFVKRLRRAYPDHKIRYFACGEYGETTQRPHYHLIVFGWFPEDAMFFSRGRHGEYNYYTSEALKRLWPYGLHIVSDVTWESCAYTARYVVKKFTGSLSYKYEEKNIKPPFVVMSRKPGIAYDYYMENRNKFVDDRRQYYLSTNKGSISFSKPRYFKKLDEPEEYKGFIPDGELFLQKVNDNSSELYEIADDQEDERKIVEFQTDLDYYENLLVDALYEEQKTSILKRGAI